MRPFEGRRVLLLVSGSIAAYKSPVVVRRLCEAGATVDVAMTRSAQKFVGPSTFAAVSGRSVHVDLWEHPLVHIDLGREADVAVIAPATADLLARMAAGRADDLVTATLLAADCPILACPAMNLRMWKHPATQANVVRLAGFGVRFAGPAWGALAEDESGPGRMEEPEVVFAEIGRLLEPDSVLSGRRVVVTAGPTWAALDDVRFVGNRSSGRMGFELASAAWRRGAEVVLIAGPTPATPPEGPRLVRVESSEEMLAALRAELETAAVLIMAAAVADFCLDERPSGKLKKDSGARLELSLARGPDLLSETRALRERRGVFTLGFALEAEDHRENAAAKLAAKGMDLVALNPVGEPDAGMGACDNRVTVMDCAGVVEELPLLSKREAAEKLLDLLEERLRD